MKRKYIVPKVEIVPIDCDEYMKIVSIYNDDEDQKVQDTGNSFEVGAKEDNWDPWGFDDEEE